MLALVAANATVGVDVLPTLDRFARGQEPPLSLSPAFGGTQVGGKWPGGIVRYFNAAPEHDWALQQAVAAWNGSGAHVRFEASTEQLAQLVITSKDVEKCGHGHATLGWTPRARATVFRPGDGPGCDSFSAARVLAHELGHVHRARSRRHALRRDELEGQSARSGALPAGPPWQWRCRLLEEADVLAAAKLYGGHPAPARGTATARSTRRCSRRSRSRSCPSARPPAASPSPSCGRPTRSRPPSWTGLRSPVLHLRVRERRLSERPGSPRYRWSVAPGEPSRSPSFPVLGKGAHCLRVWAADQMGGSATVLHVAGDVT